MYCCALKVLPGAYCTLERRLMCAPPKKSVLTKGCACACRWQHSERLHGPTLTVLPDALPAGGSKVLMKHAVTDTSCLCVFNFRVNTASGVHGPYADGAARCKRFDVCTTGLHLPYAPLTALCAGGSTASGVHGPTLTVLPDALPAGGVGITSDTCSI
jgi:hypothetical protein